MRYSAFLIALTAFGAGFPQHAPQGKSEGIPTAPITIEVFSDFQCPGCKTFHEGSLNSLRYDFVAKGKVLLVFREFPLPVHPYSRRASSVACAAAHVGKYTEVANVLFAKQNDWAASGKVEDVACSVLTPAVAQKVRALAKESAVAAEIQRDLQLGQAAGVNSTPTLMITYKMKRYPYSGTTNYTFLRSFLNDLLAK